MGLFDGAWADAKLCLVRTPGSFLSDDMYVYAVDLREHTNSPGDFTDTGGGDVKGVFELKEGMTIRIQGDGGGNFRRSFFSDGEIKFTLTGAERYVDVDGETFKVPGIHPNFLDGRELQANWVRMFEKEVEVEVLRADWEFL